nr:MAG TPA: hypothetical protein [Siphoviridae sp. ctuK76]
MQVKTNIVIELIKQGLVHKSKWSRLIVERM